MPGRKQDEIWDKFERLKSGKGYKAVCIGCKQSMQGIVERMKLHVRNCLGGGGRPTATDDEDDIQVIETVQQPQPAVSVSASSTSTSTPTTATGAISTSNVRATPTAGDATNSTSVTPRGEKRQRTATLSNYVVRTSRSEKEELDIAVSVHVFCSSHLVYAYAKLLGVVV